MALTLVPTTELEAVNSMLLAIGEAPVAQLENSGLGDAATARSRLTLVSRRVQKRGWSWNTDYNLSLPIDSNGYVNLPNDCLRFNPTGAFDQAKLVQRGTQVYDAWNNTFVFTTTLTADVVHFLDFSILPETARQAILLAATVDFQAGFVASDSLDKFILRDAQMAWAELISDEVENLDCNIFTDDLGMVQNLSRTNSTWWLS